MILSYNPTKYFSTNSNFIVQSYKTLLHEATGVFVKAHKMPFISDPVCVQIGLMSDVGLM